MASSTLVLFGIFTSNHVLKSFKRKTCFRNVEFLKMLKTADRLEITCKKSVVK